jgi:hypothetical protein
MACEPTSRLANRFFGQLVIVIIRYHRDENNTDEEDDWKRENG